MPPVDVLHLPKLGQTLSTADAEPETEEFLINRACTRPVLADRLKHYGFQGISGWKRDKLIAKLTEYANDRTQWKGQFVPAKNQSRGKFSGASSKRGTAKRSRAMLDGDDDALDQEGFVSKYPAQGFEDTRTAQDIKTLRHLADLVVSMAISDGRCESEPTIGSRPDVDGGIPASEVRIGPSSSGIETGCQCEVQQQPHECNNLHVQFGILGRQLQQMQYAHTMQMNSLSQLFITSQVTPPMLGVPWAPTYPYTAQLASHAAWPAVTMLQSGSNIAGDNSRAANSPITRPLTPPFAPPSHCQPVLLPSHPSHPQPAEGLSPGAPSKVSVLALRADENVEFEASDLSRLDTPTISFADRLDSLFTEWYTGSAAYVSVKGKPVPICQWDRLYKRSQGCEQEKIWRSNGPQWGQWKSIMQEYEVLGKDQKIFWSKYSKADGTRLHYSAIVDRLRDGRSAMDERDADNARRFFNGNLEHPDAHNAFVYRKSGKRYIKKKASIVASAWRNLLAANEDVRSRWEASQGQAHS